MVVGLAHLVVVDESVGLLVPDSDAELVGVVLALTVDGAQHEPVLALTIDRAHSLVHRLGTGHDQPVIAVRVKVQVGNLDLKLGLSRRRVSALLVLAHKAEGRLACQSWVGDVGALGRVNPAPT